MGERDVEPFLDVDRRSEAREPHRLRRLGRGDDDEAALSNPAYSLLEISFARPVLETRGDDERAALADAVGETERGLEHVEEHGSRAAPESHDSHVGRTRLDDLEVRRQHELELLIPVRDAPIRIAHRGSAKLTL